MSKRCWLVKQEPADYPWSKFFQDRSTAWTGVRNFQARIHLRSMARGDPVLQTMPLVRLSRLSVSPVTNRQFRRLLELSRTVLPTS